MADIASRDKNYVTTLLAVSSVDGISPVTLYADPVTHRLLVSATAIAIGNSVTGGTSGSVLFVSAAGFLTQDNANFYFQDNATSPSVLAINTNVALALNTNGDFTGTDALNIYAQFDAFLPNSAITNSLVGLNTDGAFPGYTTSSARGTGSVPIQLNANDMVGGYFGFGAQGASSPTYQNLGGMAIITTGSSANNLGGEVQFYTKADGGSLIKNLSILNNGNIAAIAKVSTYNSVATTGWGVPAIYATGRFTAQVAAVASVATYTVGAADGSFYVSANVLVTTATLHTFTATVAYTDEGNTARTVTMQFSTVAGAFVTAMTNAQGAVPYEGVPLHIRAKSGTAITVATTGTFTTVTYNVEASIAQIS